MNKKIFATIYVIVIVFFMAIFKEQIMSELTKFASNLGKPLYASLYTFLITLISVTLTHYFSSSHYKNIYERERFQTLYMPILNRIIAYYDVKTHWRRGHDVCDNVSESDIEKLIIEHVSNEIKYSSSELVSEYINLDRYNYIEDFKGDMLQIDFLRFCKVILKDVIRLNRKCKIFDVSLEKRIKSYYEKYTIYSIVANIINDDYKSTSFISWQWQFKKISKITYLRFCIMYRLSGLFKDNMTIIKYLVSKVSNDEEQKELYMNIFTEI